MTAALPVKRGNWRREAAARGFKWKAGNANAARPAPDAGGGGAGFQVESGNRERRQTGTGRGGQTPATV
jgi:hypothetical protein